MGARHPVALAAAAAQSGEHCIRNQMKDARHFGAAEGEILGVLQIAAYMCHTRSQPCSFRSFAEEFGKKLERCDVVTAEISERAHYTFYSSSGIV